MTTIAWDGRTLAGDRRITAGGVVCTEWTKVLKRKDGALIGVAGEMCTGSEFQRWFMNGEKGKKPELKASVSPDECASAIIVRPNGTVEAHDRDGWHVVESTQYAIGSGGNLAKVAMRCGVFADCAVEIASEFDVYTGNKVDFVSHVS